RVERAVERACEQGRIRGGARDRECLSRVSLALLGTRGEHQLDSEARTETCTQRGLTLVESGQRFGTQGDEQRVRLSRRVAHPAELEHDLRQDGGPERTRQLGRA